MSDLFTISSSVLPYSARVVAFRGTETLSRPYHFEIFLQLMGEEFDLDDAIGAKALLIVDRDQLGIPPFYFAGIFGNVEVLHAFEGRLLVRAHLVPRLWQLGLSRHSRIFTKMRVPDILTTILEENGISDYELRLGGYEVEEHVTQYRESDLDFISRWMEREGIYYFFEHGDDGEKLVLADDKAYENDPQGTPIPYFPQIGQDHTAGQHFRAFTGQKSTLPASVRLKDYDYTKPKLEVAGTATVAESGAGQVSLYGERFFTPSAGQRYAKLRAGELLARQAIYRAKGTRLHLRPGYAFELENHPFGSFNTRYLTIEARHSGNQTAALADFRELIGIFHDDAYQVEIDAIPAETQFRAESLTAWPRIYGYEHGVVDGPADSEHAQIDDMGRYKAKFNFDEGTLKNGAATTWVRMMQPHGGDVEGFHFPLRKGTEVVFCFQGGDPDRPVLFGVVPNAVKPSPVTSSNPTRNVLQTGARNRLEMEDQGGGQWIHLSTPAEASHLFLGTTGECDHNFVLETQGTGHLHTADKMDVDVDGALEETVKGDVTEQYYSNVSQTINGHKRTMVLTGKEETVMAGFNQTILAFSRRMILGPYNQTHQGTHTHMHMGSHAHTHLGSLSRTRVGTTEESLVGNVSRVIAGDVRDTVSGKVGWMVGGNVDFNTTGTTHIHSNGSITIDTPADITMEGSHVKVTAASEERHILGQKFEHKGSHNEITTGTLIELTAALKAAFSIGVLLDVNLAFAFKFVPFEHKIAEARTQEVLLDLATTPFHSRMGGLINNMAGLFVVE